MPINITLGCNLVAQIHLLFLPYVGKISETERCFCECPREDENWLPYFIGQSPSLLLWAWSQTQGHSWGRTTWSLLWPGFLLSGKAKFLAVTLQRRNWEFDKRRCVQKYNKRENQLCFHCIEQKMMLIFAQLVLTKVSQLGKWPTRSFSFYRIILSSLLHAMVASFLTHNSLNAGIVSPWDFTLF